jgi:hypothetical protein
LIVGDCLGRLCWGRIMCGVWLLGILVYTTSVDNIGQVYGGKFVVGIGLGQMSVIAPAYVAVSSLFPPIQSCLTDLHYQGMCSFPKQR